MSEFINLTSYREGEKLYLRTNFISSFARDKDKTYLNMTGEQGCYPVRETPEEILQLIIGNSENRRV